MLFTSHREQFRLAPQALTHFRPRCHEDLCFHHSHQCYNLVKRCAGMDRTDDPSGLPAPEKQMGFKHVRQQQGDWRSGAACSARHVSRESGYSSRLLCSKNATSGMDGKRKQASIKKVRRSLVDLFTEECQVAIESAIVEGSQFHLDRRGITCNSTRKLEERK